MKATCMKSILFLSSLLVLLLSLCFTAAADNNDEAIWDMNQSKKCKVEAEIGQTIPLSDSLVLRWGEGHLHPEGKWSSSNKKVASVNKKTGVVKTKKTGKAKISLKAGKTTYTCTLTVKKKGSILKGNYKKLYKQIQTIKKYSKKKITASNFSKMVTAYNKYFDMMQKYKVIVHNSGAYGKNSKQFLFDYDGVYDFERKLTDFAEKASVNMFTVTKIKRDSAKSITVTLSKPVSAFQIAVMRYLAHSTDDTYEPLFYFYGTDTKNTLDVYAACKFIKGSKTVKGTLTSDSDGDFNDVKRVAFNKKSESFMCAANGKTFEF